MLQHLEEQHSDYCKRIIKMHNTYNTFYTIVKPHEILVSIIMEMMIVQQDENGPSHVYYNVVIFDEQYVLL